MMTFQEFMNKYRVEETTGPFGSDLLRIRSTSDYLIPHGDVRGYSTEEMDRIRFMGLIQMFRSHIGLASRALDDLERVEL